MSRYGWRPDRLDPRDHRMALPVAAKPPPPHVDLRGPFAPPVYDQGEIGSCTAQAVAAAMQYDQARQPGGRVFRPSRLFIYYWERAMEGSVGEDSGAEIRDGIKVVARLGAPPEYLWPYLPSKFAVEPPAQVTKAATRYRALEYRRVRQSVQQLTGTLSLGFPVIFGFSVYPSFESTHAAMTGDVQMPGDGESPVGGHAVLMVGYDALTQRFLVRNSWGAAWGDRGYCRMPYAYVADPALAADFWVITAVEEELNAPQRLAVEASTRRAPGEPRDRGWEMTPPGRSLSRDENFTQATGG